MPLQNLRGKDFFTFCFIPLCAKINLPGKHFPENMCGINLIIDKKKVIGPAIIHKMASALHHRGPDDTRSQTIDAPEKTHYLASNRLKITDPSDNAAQPFMSSDSRFALIYNGEIYNYQSLKNQLIDAGISFTSHSDTEVLFHWLRVHGKAGIARLEGMFAFVFMDFENDDILIARDRHGIKPIYYYEDDRCFIASSEIKPLLETGLVKKELNDTQIHHYLLYKYARGPETFYKNIYEVPPGTVMHFHGKQWLSECFEHRQSSGKNILPDINEVEGLLTDSLLQQVNCNVPLGLLLSGGVDSTLLLALAKKEGFSMPTFSIVNAKSEDAFGTRDNHFSRLAATTYESDHHEIEMDISILDQFDCFVQNMDQPIGDSAYLMTSEICKKASNSMKVLLSGAGADELFAGYNRHWAFHKYLKNRKILGAVMPLIKPMANAIPTGKPYPFRKLAKQAKKWVNSHDKLPETTFHNYLGHSDVFPDYCKDRANKVEIEQQDDWLKWALWHDQSNYLIHDVLALSDRAAMRHGVESRVPYLDDHLVNYANGLSSKSLLAHEQKWILKEILEKNGGKKFIHRPKEGFGLPLSSWLMDSKVQYLWEWASSTESLIFDFVDRQKIDQLILQQKQKSEDHGPLLWSILTLSHWLQHNFG